MLTNRVDRSMVVKSSIGLFFLLFLNGCSMIKSIFYGDPEVSTNPLRGFQIMESPQSRVSLGAIWIENYGPNGDGVDESNIIRSDGISTYTYSNNTDTQIIAQLSKLLGVSGVDASSISITLHGIERHRVKNIFDSQARPGESVLYEAIKVKSIVLTKSDGGLAGIRARLPENGAPLRIVADSGIGRHISIEGTNLFIAYRVAKFVSLEYVRHNVMVDGSATDMFLSVFGYHIGADASEIDKCVCEQKNKFQKCMEIPIQLKITESFGVSVGGVPAEMTLAYRPAYDWNKNYILSQAIEKELPTGTVYRARYLNLDLRRVIHPPIDPHRCSIDMSPGGSGGEVVEAYYELRV